MSLNYTSNEIRSETGPGILVLEIDFTARIRSAHGAERLVIIEIQKAKLATDIMRFRKYLGEQYANNKNVWMVEEPTVRYRKPLPILSIYFLGYKLNTINAPVIKIQREYYDLASGNKIKAKDEFIESLTHDSFVIQIPYLKQRRQTELLRVLSIFDQSNIEEDYHILNVREEDLPERYRPIIRRLQRAHANVETRNAMEAEDRHWERFRDMQRMIEKNLKDIEENQKALEENRKSLEEKDRIIEELKMKLKNKR